MDLLQKPTKNIYNEEAASSAIAISDSKRSMWLQKTKSMFLLLRATKKRSNDWSRLLLRACQKCCFNVACCCCSLKKTDLTLDTCWALLFHPFCVSFYDGLAFYHVPDETDSLKLINLLQCCIIFFFLRLCSYFLYKTNVSVVKKESAYQETNDHCKYCV